MMRRVCLRVAGGSTSTRTLQPDVRLSADAFIRYLMRRGVRVEVTSTFRDYATQRALWENYLAGCSRFPAAPPGRSRHGTGRAFDLKLTPPVYAEAGRIWESIGGTWGGRFSDPIHFEA